MSASRIVVATGTILARGGDGGSVTSTGMTAGGAGGGGSGGLISLVAPSVAIELRAVLSARGGAGGRVALSTGSLCASRGGDGGVGRVVIRTRCASWVRQGSFEPVLATARLPASMVTIVDQRTPARSFVVS